MGRMVYSLRLEPWVIQRLSEIPGMRKKIEMFCVGIAEMETKKKLLEQSNIENNSQTKPDFDLDKLKNFFSQKIQEDFIEKEIKKKELQEKNKELALKNYHANKEKQEKQEELETGKLIIEVITPDKYNDKLKELIING